MRGIILAAGEGTRLRPFTIDRPKCLVELDGQALLDHQLNALSRCGVDDVTVVTGYRSDKIEARGLRTIHNPAYDRSNMVASLMCAADLLDGGDDVLISYADIVYEPRIVEALIKCSVSFCTAVDLDWLRLWSLRHTDPLEDAETLKVDQGACIVELGKKPNSLEEIQAQYMGLIKLAASFCPTVVAFYDNLDPTGPYDGKDRANMYMTSFLQALVNAGYSLQSVPIRGGWLEVDSVEDLLHYRSLAEAGILEAYWNPC